MQCSLSATCSGPFLDLSTYQSIQGNSGGSIASSIRSTPQPISTMATSKYTSISSSTSTSINTLIGNVATSMLIRTGQSYQATSTRQSSNAATLVVVSQSSSLISLSAAGSNSVVVVPNRSSTPTISNDAVQPARTPTTAIAGSDAQRAFSHGYMLKCCGGLLTLLTMLWETKVGQSISDTGKICTKDHDVDASVKQLQWDISEKRDVVARRPRSTVTSKMESMTIVRMIMMMIRLMMKAQR